VVLNNVILSTPIVCIVLVIINISIILHGHTMKHIPYSMTFMYFLGLKPCVAIGSGDKLKFHYCVSHSYSVL
jgi:uncharacterized membrane protein YphA (DoxX/SURF4 family)